MSMGSLRACGESDAIGATALLSELGIPLLGTALDDRQIVYKKFLAGQTDIECTRSHGYEIGALHKPANIPPACKAAMKYIDQVPLAELQQLYPEHIGKQITHVDIVDNANTLASVPSESGDFFIGSHTIEHMPLPITAVRNWLRVLKKGGLLFMLAPDKCTSFDKHRLTTTFEHLVAEEYASSEQRAEMYIEHLREWTLSDLHNHNKKHSPDAVPDRDEYATREAMYLEAGKHKKFQDRGGMHFHTWNRVSFVEFLVKLANHPSTKLPFKILGMGFGTGDLVAVLEKI